MNFHLLSQGDLDFTKVTFEFVWPAAKDSDIYVMFVCLSVREFVKRRNTSTHILWKYKNLWMLSKFLASRDECPGELMS